MTAGTILLLSVAACTIILVIGMMWGDYQDGEDTLLFKRKKSGVNSGAKFG